MFIQRVSIYQFHCCRLTFLYLGGNKLQTIPPELGDLSKLSALMLCGNQLQFLPRQLKKLTSLESLRLHDNQLQTLPQEIICLKNLRELSLRNNPLVVRFVREWSDTVPTLVELSGRSIHKHQIPYDFEMIPETLCHFLDSARCCDNPSCMGVYFTSSVRRVKFVDFCGKYRVPLMQYLCSAQCDEEDSRNCIYCCSSSSDDETDEKTRRKIRQVLLA